ncbi:TPA: helix-turn-helix transcriptional regulator [Proteus mirabilis]|nr:helix-turn-helix transcriptional regulator [Proteus mirabilis]
MSDDDVLKNFGLNVSHWRKMRYLSQEKLAEIADLDRTYISSIERGKRNVSLLNIYKISMALEISPCDLLIKRDNDD